MFDILFIVMNLVADTSGGIWFFPLLVEILFFMSVGILSTIGKNITLEKLVRYFPLYELHAEKKKEINYWDAS